MDAIAQSEKGLPSRKCWGNDHAIAAPSHESFTSRFGHVFPKPHFLESDLGVTALYDFPAPSGTSKYQVVIVHGLSTPALGMWPLVKEVQTLNADVDVVLFDLWGHGFSSTPIIAHAPHIFHFQILQVLGFKQWTRAHITGFSFGGSTAVTFANNHPWAVSSAAILAPAGLMRFDSFEERMQELLRSPQGREAEARECVLTWLEGGPMVVPENWQDRVKSGEPVAEVLREWELQEHKGYPYSVLSMFRDGGVYGFDDKFGKFAKLPIAKIGVLAELDDVCNQQQLANLGFDRVEVVKEADHAFVRNRHKEVAHILNQFWSQLA